MKKTPHRKEDGIEAARLLWANKLGPDDDAEHMENFRRALIKWQGKLDKWEKELFDAAARNGAIFIALVILSGCQAFPTLNHPRQGDVSFWSEMPYYNPYRPFYPTGYYEDYRGISRNDFIIAAEAAQAR